MNPVISILIPVYNVAPFLPKCIKSVLLQTYTNLEIILVDDGSTDESGMLCDQFAAEDSRIKVIHQKNTGVGSARNVALSAASGEFIMFVDPDDYISVDAVQDLYERIVADKSALAVGKYVTVHEDGTSSNESCGWMRNCIISGQEALSKMGEDQKMAIALWAKLYRKAVFNGIFCPELSYGEDLWIFPAIMERCERISIVDREIYYYYQRENSIMHAYSEKTTRDRLEATLFMTQYLWQHGLLSGAYKWFGYSIGIAWPLRSRAEAESLFLKYFDNMARKHLMQSRSIKERIKYLSIYSQFFYEVFYKGGAYMRILRLRK